MLQSVQVQDGLGTCSKAFLSLMAVQKNNLHGGFFGPGEHWEGTTLLPKRRGQKRTGEDEQRTVGGSKSPGVAELPEKLEEEGGTAHSKEKSH